MHGRFKARPVQIYYKSISMAIYVCKSKRYDTRSMSGWLMTSATNPATGLDTIATSPPPFFAKRLGDNSIIICVTRVISHVLQTVKMLEKWYSVCTDGLTSCQVSFYYCPESRGHIWCKQYFLYIIGKLVFATRGDICCSIEFNSIRCLQSLLLNSVCITISLGPNFVTRARDSSNLLPAKVADRFWMLSAK